MTKREFDTWCTRNLDTLRTKIVKEYPKVKDTIDNDIIEFYTHVVEKELYHLHSYGSYLYAWVYNRNFRYHKKHKHNSQIEIESIPEIIEETEDTEVLEHLCQLIEELPLDFKILYDLYYVQELTTREIGKIHGISHVGIHKQIKRMQKILKQQLCSQQ